MVFRSAIMGIAFVVMWSSAFSSARVIVLYAPPITSLSFRFLISGLIAVGLAMALGQRLNLNRQQWFNTIIFGICQNALYLGLNFVAMQTIEAGLAAIIASTMPLIVAFLSWIVLREKTPPIGILGLFAGFAGVALIMSGRFDGGADPFGLALCVIGALALAIATLVVRGAVLSGGDARNADIHLHLVFGGGICLYNSGARACRDLGVVSSGRQDRIDPRGDLSFPEPVFRRQHRVADPARTDDDTRFFRGCDHHRRYSCGATQPSPKGRLTPTACFSGLTAM
jgi:drug/metabolite transporter (DMT)-like permease